MTPQKERLLLTPPGEVYERDVIASHDYRVLFSNQGTKRHKHPTLPPNDIRAKVKCAVPDCGNLTRRMDGLCGKHGDDKEFDRRPYLRYHTADWFGALLLAGENNSLGLNRVSEHFEAMEWLLGWAIDGASRNAAVDSFVLDVAKSIHGRVPDATALQESYSRRTAETGPDTVLGLVGSLVVRHFPASQYDAETVRTRFKDMPEFELPLPVAATMLALGFACEEINRGDAWAVGPQKASRAGCWMPVAYFLLRSHAKLTRDKARICITRRG